MKTAKEVIALIIPALLVVLGAGGAVYAFLNGELDYVQYLAALGGVGGGGHLAHKAIS